MARYCSTNVRQKSNGSVSPVLVKALSDSLGAHDGKRFAYHVNRFLRMKGKEWTAMRLKALWNVALLKRAGMEGSIPEVLRESRINRCGVQGLPRGIEGRIILRFYEAARPSRMRKVAAALRSYTGIYLDTTSEAQMAKMRQSITGEALFAWRLRPQSNRERLEMLNSKSISDDLVTILPFAVRKGAYDRFMRLDLRAVSGTSSYPYDEAIHLNRRDKEKYPYLSAVASLLTKGFVPQELIDFLGDNSLRQAAAAVQVNSTDYTYGNISVIQEGGAKARVVCTPNAWVQIYMKPLHDSLMSYITSLEKAQFSDKWVYDSRRYVGGVSCVTDQVAGAYVAMTKMEQGSFISGVDLSSATDRFPLELQLAVLEELDLGVFAKALRKLAGPYRSPNRREEWCYAAGQPMGLYGSFPLFHLTHYSVLNAICLRLGLPAGGKHFAVVGDDVLIFDKALEREYLRLMGVWGVPISNHKSYSGELVEFAGFVITRKGGIQAFRPYKWGHDFALRSAVNYLFNVGLGKWPTNWWVKRHQWFTRTLGKRDISLSPFYTRIPDTYGIGALVDGPYLRALMGHVVSSHDSPWSLGVRYDELEEGLADIMGQTHDEAGHVRMAHEAFDIQLYKQQEKLRKSTWKNFYRDPLIQESMGNRG